MKNPKTILLIFGIVSLTALTIAAAISLKKIGAAKAVIEMKDMENKALQKEKEYWKVRYDSLDAEHNRLQEISERQLHFADSMVNYLSRFGKRIVLIHEDDNIVGSMDIGGQLRAYTDFLNMAQADSLR